MIVSFCCYCLLFVFYSMEYLLSNIVMIEVMSSESATLLFILVAGISLVFFQCLQRVPFFKKAI